MCRVVAVCTCSGNIDFTCGGRRLGSGRIEDYGKALTGRRRDAFRRTLITDGLVGARTLGVKEVHVDYV